MKSYIIALSAFIFISSAAMAQSTTQPKPKEKAKTTKTAKTTKAKTTSKEKAAPVTVSTPTKQFEITFDHKTHNFGTIAEGSSVTHVFTFTNTGKEPVIIQDAVAGCGCTKPTFSPEPVMPGKQSTISVTFNSAGKMGAQTKDITVTSNAGTEVLQITCVVEKQPTDKIPGQ